MALGSASHKRFSCAKNGVNVGPEIRDYRQKYPKWSGPPSHASVLFQEMLFHDTCVLAQPIPGVPFKIVLSKTGKETGSQPYRESRKGSVVLEHL